MHRQVMRSLNQSMADSRIDDFIEVEQLIISAVDDQAAEEMSPDKVIK